MQALKPLLILIYLVITSISLGQEQFPNTLLYDDEAGSPPATLEDIKWLSGHWRGEALGGIVEEIWAPPLGGSMMGAFKLVGDGKVKFYEIETISEIEKTLILRLKHFSADLKGWEEKDKTVDFRLVKITDTKVYFDEFTIEKINEDEINMYVVIDHNELEKRFSK